MRKFLLFITTMLALGATAQTSVYFPFPDSAIVWREHSYSHGNNCCCTAMGPCLDEHDFEYFLNGDTLIGTILYKKILKTGIGLLHVVGGAPTCPPWCTNYEYYYYNNLYSGAMRQDTAQRKIFYMPPNAAQDTLLYDFNLNVGDTLTDSWINYYPSNYVTAIDSVLIGNFYHKRFQLSSSYFPSEVTIIEGIGSSLGLLSPLYSNINVSDHYNMLLCVTVNGLTVYPDTSTVCALVSNINEINDNFSFSIFPNPFAEKLNIKLNNGVNGEIILYDIISRKLLQQTFTNSASINTSQLAKGIYIYEMRNKNGVIKKGKIVKD